MRTPDADATAVRIALLGPTLVTLPSGESLRASAPRTLLAYLTAVGHPTSPETLAHVLWPEGAPAGPVAAVRTIAWRARKQVGPTLIRTDPDGSYLIDLEQCDVDAARFRELLAVARTGQDVGRPREAIAALDEAIELWRGPALVEWAWQPWATPLIAEWTELLLGAREERAALRFETGDHERAETDLTELCAEHPDREHAWALLVTHLDAAGRPRDARLAYDRARRHLAESGLEPGAELRAAVERLTRPGRRIGVQQVDLGERRLVGRDKELAVIRSIITDAIATHRSKLVIIEGEAGIGKSLLCRALVADMQADHRVLAWFTACEQQLPLPYAPLVALLRALNSAGAPAADDPALEVSWLGGSEGAELSHWQVRERFATLLSRAAQRAEAEVLVLVVDDVHWAPSLTLDVLTHILGQPATIPVVVLATHRTHGAGAADSELDDMQRRVWSEKIELTGLNRLDSTELYLHVGGDEAQADQVWQLTGGNPFYLQELGRGDPQLASSEGVVAPNAVLQRALAARAAEVPVEVRGVLALAATIGARFDETLLGAAAVSAAADGLAVDPAQVVDAVLIGLRAGLIQPADGGPQSWTFRHDLMRQNLYFSVSGRERAQGHLAIARAMQRLAGHRPLEVEQVAHHLRRAWPLASAEEAAQQLLVAAETPVALLDPRTSAQLCTDGLDVLALDPHSSPRLHHRLLVARGTALADAMEPAPARKSLLAAIGALGPDGPDGADGDLFAEAVVAYADTWRDRTLPPTVAELLSVVSQADGLGLGVARCAALAMLHVVDAPLAARLAERLAGAARQAGDVPGERRLLTAIWRWQRPAARRVSARALAELGARTGSAQLGVDAAVRAAITAAQLGEALVIPVSAGAHGGHDARSAGEALSTIWAVTVHTATGDFDLARDGIVQAAPRLADLAALLDTRPARLATLLLRQSIQLATFTGEVADTALLAPWVNLAEIPVDLDSGAINTLIRARRGDVAGARESCITLVEQAEPVLRPDLVAEYSSLARACIETGYPQGLGRTVAQLESAADEHVVRGEHLYLGPVRHRLAQWVQREGRPAQAAALYAQAAEQCAAIGARPWQVRALLAEADAQLSADDQAAADRASEAAAGLADAIGMVLRREVGELLPPDALTAALRR